MNDLFKRFGNINQNTAQQNPMLNQIKNVFGMIKGSNNPQTMMNQMMQNNPMYQNAMNYVQQNGGDAKTAFYNLAKQMGVDPNSVLSMLK